MLSEDKYNSHHEIRQRGEELGDLADGGGLLNEPVPVAVQHDLLEVLQVAVVDQGAEVGTVRRRD